jgi:SlyX protein
MTTTEARFENLETRLAHQEKTIGELSDVVTTQWRKIEALEFQLRRFGEELQSIDAGGDPSANQRPPHY